MNDVAGPPAPERRGDPLLARSVRCVVAIGVVMTAAAGVLFGLRAGFSVGAGSAFAAANLYSLSLLLAAILPGGGAEAPDPYADDPYGMRSVERTAAAAAVAPPREPSAVLPPATGPDQAMDAAPAIAPPPDAGPGGGSAAAWSVMAAAKMVVLFGGIWVCMARHWVEPLPLVVGYMSLLLGIVLATLLPDRADASRM